MNKLIVSTFYGGLRGGVLGLGLGTTIALNEFSNRGKFNKKIPLYVSSTGIIIGSYLGMFCFNPLIGLGVSCSSLIGFNLYLKSMYLGEYKK